jgi:hypothetical protein
MVTCLYWFDCKYDISLRWTSDCACRTGYLLCRWGVEAATGRFQTLACTDRLAEAGTAELLQQTPGTGKMEIQPRYQLALSELRTLDLWMFMELGNCGVTGY